MFDALEKEDKKPDDPDSEIDQIVAKHSNPGKKQKTDQAPNKVHITR